MYAASFALLPSATDQVPMNKKVKPGTDSLTYRNKYRYTYIYIYIYIYPSIGYIGRGR